MPLGKENKPGNVCLEGALKTGGVGAGKGG
jgi:hypothetical protein